MNILLIGKPGAGKGTITKEILKNSNYIHLSTGDLFRQEISTGSQLGKELEPIVKSGEFVNDEIVFDFVLKFLNDNPNKPIIFDGFPRNIQQAKKCKELNIDINHVFHLKVPNEVLEARVINRRIHLASGRVYNIIVNPPKVEGLDDITGEPLIHREDDKKEVLEKRLQQFEDVTTPILEFYEEENTPLSEIRHDLTLENQVDLIFFLVNNLKLFKELKNTFKLK